jgi:4-hydroxybenzoyl-CoA thioesterase
VEKVGGASVTVSIRLIGAEGVTRVRATLVLVTMDLKKARAARIPDAMRARIARFAPSEHS